MSTPPKPLPKWVKAALHVTILLVTGLAVSVSSTPSTLPSGSTSIELKQERWKGNIWRTRTKSFTF